MLLPMSVSNVFKCYLYSLFRKCDPLIDLSNLVLFVCIVWMKRETGKGT